MAVHAAGLKVGSLLLELLEQALGRGEPAGDGTVRGAESIR